MIVPNIQAVHDVSHDEVKKICAIKSQSWPHSMESQLGWWKNQTDESDTLVTLLKDDFIIAFLRLRSRVVSMNGVSRNVRCVTEVCVDEKHRARGVGKQLLAVASEYIEGLASSLAYLLCSDVQELFYVKCGWCRVDGCVQIQSMTGRGRRALGLNERCMVFDSQGLMKGQLILYGDVF